MAKVDFESFHAQTAAQWRQWLDTHHARPQGVWLVSYKQVTGKPRVPYDEAVEIALCFGWIDSKPRTVDDERSALWFAPRRPGSAWSQKNKTRIAQLTSAGLMHPAGLAKVAQAQQDGTWTQLDAVERLEIPPDWHAALQQHPPSATHFEAFPRSTKRAILEWIGSAKTEPTRAKRVLETAQLAATNVRANQWSKKA